MAWIEESRRKARQWVQDQLHECAGEGIETNAGVLKRFYGSDKYWPKDYTVYDLLITIEGDDNLTDDFESVGDYIQSLDDGIDVEIVSGTFNYELDQGEKPELCIREQFLIFCSRTMYLEGKG